MFTIFTYSPSLTLLHPVPPKLHRVLAILSVIGLRSVFPIFHPFAPSMVKTPLRFGRSECNSVKVKGYTLKGSNSANFIFTSLLYGVSSERRVFVFVGSHKKFSPLVQMGKNTWQCIHSPYVIHLRNNLKQNYLISLTEKSDKSERKLLNLIP